MNILLVEDDESFGYILKAYLEMNDYAVRLARKGEEALTLARQFAFGLCILDIMLPDTDGFTVAEALNRRHPELPFIFLTARALKVDKLKGYKLGCDDYITKPIDEEVLLAKIQAILKRSRAAGQEEEQQLYQLGKFRFDFPNQRLYYGGEFRPLTEKEALLLQMLCRRANELLPRADALKDIWGKNDVFNRKTMDVFIFKLRKYLEADPKVRIRNVHGKGFILEVD